MDHRRQRLIIQPAFHPRHLPDYADAMRQQTAAPLDGWRDGQVVDMVDEIFRRPKSAERTGPTHADTAVG